MALFKDVRIFMLISLAVAVIFAIAHDRFYNGLDGVDVSLYNQRLSSNIGIVFAFIIKGALGLSITAVYTQMLWQSLAKSTKTIAEVDSLTSLVNSAFELRHTTTYKHPQLLVLAIVVWFIPLAAIVPPGALSVRLAYHTVSSNISVSTLDFHNETMASFYDIDSDDTGTRHSLTLTPTVKAAKLANYVSWTDSIPPVSGVPNSSYTLSFVGPTLNCSTKRWYAAERLVCAEHNDTAINYFSWLGSTGTGEAMYFGLPETTFPEIPHGKDIITACPRDVDILEFEDADTVLYLAARTTDYNLTTTWNVTTCQLQNATYELSYDFHGSEEMQLKIHPEIMYGLNQSWITHSISSSGYHATNHTDNPVPDVYLRSFFETTNFYAIFASMAKLAVGVQIGWVPPNPIPLLDSQAGWTEEMSNLTSMLYAFDRQATRQTNISLAAVLEQLIQNITIATMTSPLLTSQKMISGKVDIPVNVYSYNRQHLWLSYGIGIGLTAVLIALSIWLIALNGGHGYSNKFSTFYRAIRHQSGADPLPQAVARTEIRLGLAHDNKEYIAFNEPNDFDGLKDGIQVHERHVDMR